MACGSRLLQLILFITNMGSWLIALFMIVASSLSLVYFDNYYYFSYTMERYTFMHIPGNAIILTGSSILLVSGILGLASACANNRGATIAFMVMAALAAVLEGVVIGCSIVHKNNVHDPQALIQMQWNIDNNYYYYSSPPYYNGPDRYQDDNKCCGAANFTDFYFSNYCSSRVYCVPYSCCNLVDVTADYQRCLAEALPTNTAGYKVLNTQGCYPIMMDTLDKRMLLVMILAGILIGCQLVGIISAWLLPKTQSSSSVAPSGVELK